MQSDVYYRIRVKTLIIIGIVVLAAGLFGTLTLAQDGLPTDLRINLVHHFGGDVLYCVDRFFNPTTQYSDDGLGGFRLLDIDGQVLWFVPTTPTIHDATERSIATGQGQLVARGQGTYGPVELWTYVNPDGDTFFTFYGFDEYVKPNQISFKFCEPVGPGQPEPRQVPRDTEDPICEPPIGTDPRSIDVYCRCLVAAGLPVDFMCTS